MVDGNIAVLEVPPRKLTHSFARTRTETISHERAQEAATRLIHSHFGQEPHARISIPVNADDDDVIICEYIRQQIEKELGFRRPQLTERETISEEHPSRNAPTEIERR